MRNRSQLRKFDGGRRTPQEVHAEYAFSSSAKCQGCPARPTIRAVVLMPADEAEKRGLIPTGASKAPHLYPAIQPIAVKLTDGWYIRASVCYACRACAPTMERALAKGPSWAVVEINRGPDPTNRVAVALG